MELLLEHEPKQASYKGKAAIEWNVDDLLAWIIGKRPKLLNIKEIDIFREANVSGEAFLHKSGDEAFFRDICKLSPGTAVVLALLPRRLVAEEKMRNPQQAEDVDMLDISGPPQPLPPQHYLQQPQRGPMMAINAFRDGIPYKGTAPLLYTSGLDWVFQPHPELYKIIAPSLIQHFTGYKTNRLDKWNTPFYFYLGGAGTGKSRHGTEFASSVKQAIELCEENKEIGELAQRLGKAFVFQVSFENGTSLTSKESSDPYSAVGIRMLHQVLGGDFEGIRKKFVATPEEVFQLVAKAEGVDLYDQFTGIVVVDGIQKAISFDTGSFYKFLDQIGDLSLMSRSPSETQKGGSRRTPFIMTCVTATFLGPAKRFLALNSRKRVYLPLNRLDAPTWKHDFSKVLNDDYATHLLVSDVGGHARAIETIADELAADRNGSQKNINELAHTVLIRLRDRYREAIDVIGHNFLPVVQCILARKAIFFSDYIPGTDTPWGYITTPGLLWFENMDTYFDYSHDTKGYLVAPYIWLWLLARVQGAGTTDRLSELLRTWKFNDYDQLLYLRTCKGEAEQATWQNFETFCCRFRLLRSLGFSDGEDVRFESLHSGCQKIRDDKATVVVNRQLDYAEAAHQYSTESALPTDVVTKYDGTLEAEPQLSYVILNGTRTSAPAGDFFIRIRTQSARSRKTVREVGKCKFVKETLNEEAYIKERNKSARSDDFFMLYTTAKTPDDIALPNRSGLVDESCWMSYFGPFAGRAYIMSRYAR